MSAAAIVVVTNEAAGTMVRACLESIVAAGGPEVVTIVVDNSPRPSSAAEEYGPGVDHVVRTDNRGFGAAANAGFRCAQDVVGADVPVALLNDDLEVDPGWLQPLVEALDADGRIGAVQPALVRHGADRINSLGVELDQYGAGSDIGLDEPMSSLDGQGIEIDIFTGGAVLFRRSFLNDTGGFDERYFLYYEDVDLALRGAEHGWRYECVTSSVVRHVGGATTGALGARRVTYQERNRLWTVARFGSPSTIGRAVWLSIRRLRHEPRSAHRRALVTGLAGIPGALLRRLRQSVSDTV